MTPLEWSVIIGLFTFAVGITGALFTWSWGNLGKRIDAKADADLRDALEKKVDCTPCDERHRAMDAALGLRIHETESMWRAINDISKSLARMELMLAGMTGKMGIAIPMEGK